MLTTRYVSCTQLRAPCNLNYTSIWHRWLLINQDLLTYTHLAQLRCDQQTSLHKQHDIELMPVIIFMVRVYGIKFLCWNQDYWQRWVDGFTSQTNETPTFSEYPVTCHPKHPELVKSWRAERNIYLNMRLSHMQKRTRSIKWNRIILTNIKRQFGFIFSCKEYWTEGATPSCPLLSSMW